MKCKLPFLYNPQKENRILDTFLEKAKGSNPMLRLTTIFSQIIGGTMCMKAVIIICELQLGNNNRLRL